MRGPATIGGIVATNDSGPRRQRYGAPRDLIIGVRNGPRRRRRRQGRRQVVKNVAGYDLRAADVRVVRRPRASITSATFKLVPVPPASRTRVGWLSA